MKRKFCLVTLLGIRPDLIRMARLINLLDQGEEKNLLKHIFIHSGQHYQHNLDGVFYEQLQIRKPDYNFQIGTKIKKLGKGLGYVQQMSALFEALELFIKKVQPHAILFLGDTNTVLASIIAARSQIPIIHIEGGGRSFDWRMPEEKNRILIDHLSDRIYCYLARYRRLLLKEGIHSNRIVEVGNIIVDAIDQFLPQARKTNVLQKHSLTPKTFGLITLHREENTMNPEVLHSKLNELILFQKHLPLVWPVMPRVKMQLEKQKLMKPIFRSGIQLIEPQGFLEFLYLEESARLIVSDSGTVQEEALLLGTPCLITRRSTERPETIEAKATILSDEKLYWNARRALQLKTSWDRTVLNPMGGSPSKRIYKDLIEKIQQDWFKESRSYKNLQSDLDIRKAYGHDPSFKKF